MPIIACSSVAAICSHPFRSLAMCSNEIGFPIRTDMFVLRGKRLSGGRAACAPSIRQGSIGTVVPAISIPIPARNLFISPLRERVPSGNKM